MISREEALKRVAPEHVETVLEARIDPAALERAEVLAEGVPACPGIATGLAVGNADDAILESEDQPVILARNTTNPEDVHGMIAAEGICTEVGGRTSHAAVVSRELGKPSIVGCGEGALQGLIGRVITLDGDTGKIYAGELTAVRPSLDEQPGLAQLARWVGEHPDALDSSHPLSKLAESQP
jgi:pyruvate,orthophosphate dikinase